MTIIAGIDEAGFGPILGPMVVSATAFTVPDADADASLWTLLTGAVTRKPSRRVTSTVAIADSKKLYGGLKNPDGLSKLECGVLSMLAAQDRTPGSLGELLDVISPKTRPEIGKYPWYDFHNPPLPHHLDAAHVPLLGNVLAKAMSQRQVNLLGLQSEVVLEGEYNRLIAATNNKSSVLFDVTCRLLHRLWRLADGSPCRIFVDRQGGRTHYLPALQRIFDGCTFKVLDESDKCSAYRIQSGPRTAELCFMVSAEDHHLPVALASMTSKYVRELFMTAFNRYWQSHLPDLTPTAGYYKDGNRFYQEIEPLVKKLGLDEAMLYRSR